MDCWDLLLSFPGKELRPPLYLGVVANEKGAFGSPSAMVANFTYLLSFSVVLKLSPEPLNAWKNPTWPSVWLEAIELGVNRWPHFSLNDFSLETKMALEIRIKLVSKKRLTLAVEMLSIYN